MPGKAVNMLSASCHSHQKGIEKPKMLKKKIENSFTFDTFKIISPQKSLHFCKLDHRWRATLIIKKLVR
jgi:hypothetical protein